MTDLSTLGEIATVTAGSTPTPDIHMSSSRRLEVVGPPSGWPGHWPSWASCSWTCCNSGWTNGCGTSHCTVRPSPTARRAWPLMSWSSRHPGPGSDLPSSTCASSTGAAKRTRTADGMLGLRMAQRRGLLQVRGMPTRVPRGSWVGSLTATKR